MKFNSAWQRGNGCDRRTFLRGTAGAALLASAGRFAFAADEPETSKPGGRLIVHTEVPKNAETPPAALVESWLTPVERFYVRSHGPAPEIDANSYRVSVEGMVERPLSLSLAELADAFEQMSVVATMTCAGNRRREHSRIKPVKGVQWAEGAIGNARWSGPRLSDVLQRAGLRDRAKHVWFDAVDSVDHGGTTISFGASIPIEKALDDSKTMPGAMLAAQMNGKPLTPDHGYPLRTVVPGYIGARSVKWLGKIVVSDRPSPNHFVATAYKLVEEGTDLEWAERAPIYRYPLNAAICTPAAGAKVQRGNVTVAGYALPTGQTGATIARVEVSADGGRRWTPAKLTSKPQEFCWQLWTAGVPVSADSSELVVRATDSKGHVQPARADWNMKGYLFDAVHRVKLDVQV